MISKSKKKTTTNDEAEFGWEAMIRDAKKRIEDLKFSIEVFEKKKASGVPWPRASEGVAGKQQHTISPLPQSRHSPMRRLMMLDLSMREPLTEKMKSRGRFSRLKGRAHN